MRCSSRSSRISSPSRPLEAAGNDRPRRPADQSEADRHRRGGLPLRLGDETGPGSGERPRGVPDREPRGECALGQRPGLRDEDPAEHQAGGMPELRQERSSPTLPKSSGAADYAALADEVLAKPSTPIIGPLKMTVDSAGLTGQPHYRRRGGVRSRRGRIAARFARLLRTNQDRREVQQPRRSGAAP